jgi:hypothetical protein
MSISSIQGTIKRLEQELARLQKQQSDETKKEVAKRKRIIQVRGSITKSTSPSLRSSKENEIIRLTEDVARIQNNLSDIEKKIGNKTAELHKAQQDLAKEQERERKKSEEANKRRDQEELRRQKEITKELREQQKLTNAPTVGAAGLTQMTPTLVQYDVFICHATEDKDEFVRPLAEQLQTFGFRVWYDEFTLKVGDSLRRSVDQGLANSRYGVVVLSSSFFAKQWPQYELDGLVAREMQGKKVILPIWHKITKDDVMTFSPSLVDKMALNSSLQSVEEIAERIAEVLQQQQ